MKLIETGCEKYVATQYRSGYTSDKDYATAFKSVEEFRQQYESDIRYQYVIMVDTVQEALGFDDLLKNNGATK